MTFKLIISVILILSVEQSISVIINGEFDDDEINSIENENYSEPILEDYEDNYDYLDSSDDVVQNNNTSQDRISYHKRKKLKHWLFGHKYPHYGKRKHRSRHKSRKRPSKTKAITNTHQSRPKPSIFSTSTIIAAGPSLITPGKTASVIPLGKPTIIEPPPPTVSSGLHSGLPMAAGLPQVVAKSPFTKMAMALKRNRPVLLSDVLRGGPMHPFAKFRPNNLAPRPVKEYVDEDELETSPFTSVGTFNSLPSMNRFHRLPSNGIEISVDDRPPINGLDDEFIHPGNANLRPYLTNFKRPINPPLFTDKLPPDIYVDDEEAQNIRNVRLATKPPNHYVGQDILNLLKKIKKDGAYLESRPETTTSRINTTDKDAAVAKLLSPYLSESSIKQIQKYLNRGATTDEKNKDEERSSNKIVYIVENINRDFNKNNNKTISVTESLEKDDTSNSTYFIMLRTPSNKNASASDNETKTDDETESFSTKSPDIKTTSSLQNLALQNYIMTLAGLSQSSQRLKNLKFFPRLSSSSLPLSSSKLSRSYRH